MIIHTDLPKSMGIYSIVNNTNGKVYIGSAVNLRQRSYDHVAMLRRNSHYSKHLQHAWNLYGEKAFDFVVLVCVLDKNKLAENEQHFIDIYQSYDTNKGYNIQRVAYSNVGYKPTEETKAKIRAARAKQIISPEAYKHAAMKRCGQVPNWTTETKQKHTDQLLNQDWSKLNTPEIRQRMVKGFKDTLRKQGKPFRCVQTGEVFQLLPQAN